MVIPTYNERERIAELVESLGDVCERAGVVLELVVVDDNSPDGTGAIVDDLARTRRLRAIHRAGKLGLGSAVAEGFAVATAPVVGVMDADFSHPPALVPDLLAVLVDIGADVVVASRYVPGGSTPKWPTWRRLLSRAACLAARPLSPVRDAASGFFVIRRDIATRVPIQAHGFKICLELLMRAWPIRLVEIPYQFDDREQGESKMSLREAAGYVTQLRQLYALRLAERSRPTREYRQLTSAAVSQIIARTSKGQDRGRLMARR
jgi:dolichol-phosphate mannosyltransferase